MRFNYWKANPPKEKPCLQCGYPIVPAPAFEDRMAQKKGFCCFGCQEVHAELLKLWKKSA